MLPPRGIAPGQVIPPAGAPRAPARAYTPPMGYNDPPMGMFQNTAPVARYNTPPPGGGYNNYPVAAMAPQRADSPATIPRALTPSHGSANSVSFALVRNAFLPSLPDELAVSQGEMVRVLSEYDDGWALCANMRGDQGAVPLECLQRQRVNVPNAGAGGVPTRSRDDQLAFVPAG
ncbi:uncharacterized protein B0H18DRAFT_1001390 [Fomitopsis serialis]|uniref:uncharacterized protein n=1 Tax=Fomitopsis serialis TaxID=139415 RepID=UPI0020089C83|nr:uncharacterized protein B0H18DRAFT_1001390 [Neoantrodia serialis]KAH9928098.1 hypothetical protein B0H18DRAFT_1001390 [Neoantrodia serialis]